MTAAEAGYLRDVDIVLGTEVSGESRAYPSRMLNWHEIVNDTLGSIPILVTFCLLCDTGTAFNPIIDESDQIRCIRNAAQR